MKIFDWVSKKLHPSMDYCKVVHNEGEKGSSQRLNEMVKIEKKSLLLDQTQVEQIHQAMDYTIFTIGTLGHFKDTYYMEEDQEEVDNRPPPPQHVPQVAPQHPTQDKQIMLEKLKNVTLELVQQKAVEVEEEIVLEAPLLSRKDDKPRTTLADLFKESDGREPPTDLLKTCEKEKPMRKDGKEFVVWNGKKVKEWKEKKPNSKGSKKLHQLMRKIMRKKVHPEVINGNMQATRGVGQQLGAKNDDVMSRSE